MNFVEAVKAMKEGKKAFIDYVIDDENPNNEPNWYAYKIGKTQSGFYDLNKDEIDFSIERMLSNEWKIVDEIPWSLCSIHEDNWIMPFYHSGDNSIIIVGNPDEKTKEYYSRNKLVGYDKVTKMINLILEDLKEQCVKNGITNDNRFILEYEDAEKIIKSRFGR